MKIKYIASAVYPQDYPEKNRPEIAIAGRSNTGKSSLINALAGSLVAKVSQVPGKTRLLNFFDVGEHYRLVDMPGYGYASRSAKEVGDWKNMIESYLNNRENLSGFLLLMDIRRSWTEEEELILNWVQAANVPIMIILTKIDKLNNNEIKLRKKAVIQRAEIGEVYCVSAMKKRGIQEIEEAVFNAWIKPHLET